MLFMPVVRPLTGCVLCDMVNVSHTESKGFTVENQNHFYIISYDVDKRAESAKSKRLLEFLRRYHAVCLTKSTWLLCTSSDCYTVFTHTSNIIEPNDFLDQIAHKGYAEQDRIFVAEITGPVFGEWLICNQKGSEFTLKELIEASGSNLIEDGFKAVYGF